MMDIDKFKRINDVFGHNLGDAILKSIAASIQNSIRTCDHAFRFGGDEFLLVLPQVISGTANQICARIEANLCEIQGYAFPLSTSIGCAMRSECTSTKEVLELADQRMYEAKRSKHSDESVIGESPIK
jgi:diguanylate cyclase (GGDEF)-like protein